MFPSLDRGVVLYGNSPRLHLIRTDSINGTYAYCDQAVQRCAVDVQRVVGCQECKVVAQRFGFR